jgi:hypothetical protein
MVEPHFHDMLADLLLADGSRVRRFLNMRLVNCWLKWFRDASRGRRFGRISRGGLYQRVFILLALEIWLREQGLEW